MKFKIFIIYIISSFPIQAEEIIIDKIKEYFINIDAFHSDFYQIENNKISSGEIYFSNNRLRIEYTSPQSLVFIMKKNNVMYFNKDLSEVQYFNPKDTPAEIFMNIFTSFDFFENSKIIRKKSYFFLEKNVFIENEKHKIKVYFEEMPLELRKIDISGNISNFSLSIINLNFNPFFDKSIFSLANPLLKQTR